MTIECEKEQCFAKSVRRVSARPKRRPRTLLTPNLKDVKNKGLLSDDGFQLPKSEFRRKKRKNGRPIMLEYKRLN